MKNIFHIGYHKTATTWFQKEFYPKTNRKSVLRKDIQSYFYDSKKINIPKSNSIFCDEELSGNIHNGGLASFLSESVAIKISSLIDSEVIIFIRNQKDIISSSYLQYVKEGGTYSLNRYLYHREFPRNNRASLFSFQHFNYYDKIKMYERLLGKENIHVYVYEDFLQNPEIFIKRFIKNHNFEVDFNSLDFKKNNRSYSYISLFLARIFNIFTRRNVLYKYYLFHIPFLYKYARNIFSRISIFPIKSKRLLGKKNINVIRDKFKITNNKLNKEYQLNLDKFDYFL